MTKISRELIWELPKTDLHCHLDGSLRISTLIELARQENVALPSTSAEVLMEHYKYGRIRKTLEEYLMGFEPLIAVMQKRENIERIAYELCEDAAKENVWHLEVRYCPYLLIRQGLSQKEVVLAVKAGIERAQNDFGINAVQILCGLKHNDGASILGVAKLAAELRDDGVVGFDLAGPEDGYPIRDHREAIRVAKENNLFVTLHAGESYGPKSIQQAIEAGADRIGHGTSLIHDGNLLNYVVDHRIGVESCPLSNLHTGSVKNLEEHPLKELLKHKARVSINTDNRLCSNTTITEEIVTVVKYLEIDVNDIHTLLVNGFKSAFISYQQRGEFLARFNERWAQILD